MNEAATMKSLKILCYALAGGLFNFAIVLFLILQINTIDYNISPTALGMGMIGSLLIFGSLPVYNYYVKKIARSASVMEKFKHYRVSNIIRWALLEAGGMLFLVAGLLSENALFLMMGIFPMLALITTAPSRRKFAETFDLSRSEAEEVP